jgi:hypothetical protein
VPFNGYYGCSSEALRSGIFTVAMSNNRYPPSHTGEIWDLFNSFNLAAGITSGIIGMFAAFIGLAVVASTPLSLLVLPAVAVVFGTAGVISMKEAVKRRGPTAFDKVNSTPLVHRTTTHSEI